MLSAIWASLTWARPLGPGHLGQATWARPLGPGTLGQATWARPLGSGHLGQASWARPVGPGTADRSAAFSGRARLYKRCSFSPAQQSRNGQLLQLPPARRHLPFLGVV